MARDDDLAGLIPDTPAPDGKRRSAAIDAALRRFDAEAVRPDPATGSEARPSRTWAVRSQLAVLASVLLISLVTIPLLVSRGWVSGRGDNESAGVPPEANVQIAATRRTRPDGRVANSVPATPRGTSADESPPTESAGTLGPPTPPAEFASKPLAEPSPTVVLTPGLPGSAPSVSRARDAVTAAPQALAAAPAAPPPPPPPPPPAPAPVAQEARMASADEAAASIVVTGARVPARAEPDVERATRLRLSAQQRRRLQACTIEAAPVVARRCAVGGAIGSSELIRGLERANKGDAGGARAAFDAGIARAPQASAGYLNRGLLRQRAGDLDAALRDFEAAIRVAPADPCGFYFRSLLLRERGDVAGANRDLRHALELLGR